jgi:hypothetical protein
MSTISRDVGHYVDRNRFTLDPDKRDEIIAFAERLGLPETMGSQNRNWHLSDATLEEFDARLRHSRPDLLAKNATQSPPSHINTSLNAPGEVRMLSGDYFDRLPAEERLRLSNSHNICRADDGTVTLRQR